MSLRGSGSRAWGEPLGFGEGPGQGPRNGFQAGLSPRSHRLPRRAGLGCRRTCRHKQVHTRSRAVRGHRCVHSRVCGQLPRRAGAGSSKGNGAGGWGCRRLSAPGLAAPRAAALPRAPCPLPAFPRLHAGGSSAQVPPQACPGGGRSPSPWQCGQRPPSCPPSPGAWGWRPGSGWVLAQDWLSSPPLSPPS